MVKIPFGKAEIEKNQLFCRFFEKKCRKILWFQKKAVPLQPQTRTEAP